MSWTRSKSKSELVDVLRSRIGAWIDDHVQNRPLKISFLILLLPLIIIEMLLRFGLNRP